MKVFNLYIAQIKQKHGIIERENYNKPKSEKGGRPECPKEKIYVDSEVEEAATIRNFRIVQTEGSRQVTRDTKDYTIKGWVMDDDRESAFLIQDMFPITEEYIEREYTIAGNHLMLTSDHTVKTIEQKARKVMGMLKRGVKFTPTQPDVMKIYDKLTKK